MSVDDHHDDQTVSEGDFLNRLREDFKQAWERAEEKPLEEFLSQAEQVSRELSPFFESLLKIELNHRAKRGETVIHSSYESRFPEYAEVIRRVLGVEDDQNTKVFQDDSIELTTPPESSTVGTFGLRPGAQIGDYEILAEIARGGMGVVYKARQTELKRIVALKTIKAVEMADDHEIQRFLSEAEAAANLDHPNIVPVYEVGAWEGRHFFSMGFVEGESLAAKVATGPLPARQAASIVKTLGQAVDYAHCSGIVHRDLKPANVLIDRDGQPKITDFGLAKKFSEDSGLTATGQVMGTPSFMPPEQALGQIDEVGPSSDVYSLGAVLYCLLTGRPPFQTATLMETLKQVIESPPVAPRRLNPDIPKDLETICLKCLEKEPSKRYKSAAALAADLQRFLDDMPVLARPVSNLEMTLRWCRRNRLITVLTVLFLVAIFSGVAGSTYFAFWMRSEAIRADKNSEDALSNQKIAEQNAREALEAQKKAEQQQYDALLSKTQLYISTAQGELGWTWKALEDIQEAASLKIPERDEATLRSVLLESLMTFDARKIATLPLVKNTTFADDIAFSPDGRILYVAESKGVPTCYLTGFDMETMEPVESYRISTLNSGYLSRLLQSPDRYQTGFRELGISPDGRWICGGGRFGEIYLWDRNKPGSTPVKLQAREEVVERLQFSPDSKTLYSSTNDSDDLKDEIRIWEFSQGQWSLKESHEDIGSRFSVSHDGRRLATCTSEEFRLYDVDSFDIVSSIAKRSMPMFSPDDSMVAGVEHDRLFLFTADTLQDVNQFGDPEIEGAEFFRGDYPQFFGDTHFCAVSGVRTEGVRIYHLGTGDRVATLPTPGLTEPDFAVSSDGRLMAVAEAHSVGLYEVRIPIQRNTHFNRRTEICDLEFFPDGKRLAVMRHSWGGDLRTTALETFDVTDPNHYQRWRTYHSGGTGNTYALDSNKLMRFATGSSPHQMICSEPQLGVHLSDEYGNISFPKSMPPIRLTSLQLPVNSEIPISVKIPVNKQVPYYDKKGKQSLKVRIDDVLTNQLELMNESSDRYLIYINLSIPSDRMTDILFRARVSGESWKGNQISEGIRAVESRQAFLCGKFVREELSEKTTLEVSLEDLFEKDRPPVEIILESVLLVARPGLMQESSDNPRGPVELASDQTQMIAATNIETLGVWDLPEGDYRFYYQDRAQKTLRGVSGVDTADIDHGLVAAGSRSGLIVIHDAKSGERLEVIDSPGGGLRQLIILDPERLVVTTQEGHIQILHWKSKKYTPITQAETSVLACEITTDERLLCYATLQGHIVLLERHGNQWKESLKLGPFSDRLVDVDLSHDGRYLVFATAARVGSAQIIDLESLELQVRSLSMD